MVSEFDSVGNEPSINTLSDRELLEEIVFTLRQAREALEQMSKNPMIKTMLGQ